MSTFWILYFVALFVVIPFFLWMTITSTKKHGIDLCDLIMTIFGFIVLFIPVVNVIIACFCIAFILEYAFDRIYLEYALDRIDIRNYYNKQIIKPSKSKEVN